MRKTCATILLLVGLNIAACYGQHKPSDIAVSFFAFVNDYQVDSLQRLLANDFRLKRTYINYGNDKKSFIENYIPNSKHVNGKFRILSIAENEEGTLVLVEDQSDYLALLKVDFPKWRIQLTTNEKRQIKMATIDTTESYQSYLKQVQEKGQQFEDWVKQKYPAASATILHGDQEMLMRRLREYAGR